MNRDLIEVYQIKVRGKLDTRWSAWFGDMTIACEIADEGIALTALTNGAFVVISVTLLLYLCREKYGDLGFHRHRLLRQIGLGALFGVLIFVLDTFLVGPLTSALVPETASSSVDMSVFFGELSYLPIWLAMALLKGGFTEELWRIFGLTRFEKRFGRTGLVLALIAGSLAFGLGHGACQCGTGTALRRSVFAQAVGLGVSGRSRRF
jgi:membrane protease YdiL (CAAX protease family)